jgi:hypothetical protein
LDIVLLALLRASTEENDNEFTLFGEIDAITWAEIDFALLDPSTNAFGVGEIP